MIYLLVPVRDDARRLERLLPVLARALPGERTRLVVVDDGSRDDTPAVVRRCAGALDLWLVTHVRPRGRAAALRTARELVFQDAPVASDLIVAVDPRDPAAADRLAGRVAHLRESGEPAPVPSPLSSTIAVARAGFAAALRRVLRRSDDAVARAAMPALDAGGRT